MTQANIVAPSTSEAMATRSSNSESLHHDVQSHRRTLLILSFRSYLSLCVLPSIILSLAVISPVGVDVPVSRRGHGGEGEIYAGQVQREGPLAVGAIDRHAVLGAVVVRDPVVLGGRVQPSRVPAGVKAEKKMTFGDLFSHFDQS